MAHARGYEAITVSDSAVGLTDSVYSTSTSALITVEANAIRFRVDGVNPAADEGHVLEAGDVLKLTSADELQRIRFIRRDSSDGTIRVTYFTGHS